MSGTGEERWRSSRAQHSNQQAKPNESRKGAPPPTADRQHGLPTMPSANSAWASGQGGGRGDARVPHDHAAEKRFDAKELQAFLKKAFDAEAGSSAKAQTYRSPPGQGNGKTGGPWASKPNTMANGKDFFVELRKQVAALQQIERAGG